MNFSRSNFHAAQSLRIHWLPLAVALNLIWLCFFLAVPVMAQQSSATVAPVAATNGTATKAPILTADAVQEAFVRVAERIKLSVVTVYAERTPRRPVRRESQPPGKPDKAPNKPNQPGTKPPAKPDAKPSKPTPSPDPEEEEP